MIEDSVSGEVKAGVFAGCNLGTLENCTLEGDVLFEGTFKGCGGIAGENGFKEVYGGSDIIGRISDCQNQGTIDISTSQKNTVSAIVHANEGIVERCTNNGTVKAGKTGSASGICYSMSRGRIASCINQANIEGETAAGILNSLSGGTVYGCINRGDISADPYEEGTRAVGIVCSIDNSSTQKAVSVEKCSNLGTITGSGVAGICIGARQFFDDTDRGVVFRGCENRGTIQASRYAGGIVLSIQGDTTLTWNIHQVNLTDCLNSGEIKGGYLTEKYGTEDIDILRAGGIACEAQWTNIENCTNVGDISASMAGGIVQYAEKCTVYLCSNKGTITDTKTNENLQYSMEAIGGLVGYITEGTIKECYNQGALNALMFPAGGLVGILESSAIENSYNCGDIDVSVKGDWTFGHYGCICGEMTGSDVLIKNCYNIGKVTKSFFGEYHVQPGVIAGYSNRSSGGSAKVVSFYYLDNMETLLGEKYGEGIEFEGCKQCSEDDLLKIGTYSGWDFSAVWCMGSNEYRYPVLRKNEMEGSYDAPEEQTYRIQVLDSLTKKPVKNAGVLIQYSADKGGEVNKYYITDENGTASVNVKMRESTVHYNVQVPKYKTADGYIQLRVPNSEAVFNYIIITPDEERYKPDINFDIDGDVDLSGIVALETADGERGDPFDTALEFDIDFGVLETGYVYDEENDLIKFAITSSPLEGGYSEKSVDELKNVVKRREPESLEEIFGSYKRKMKVGVSGSVNIAGYLIQTGAGEFVEGGLMVVFTGDFEWHIPFYEILFVAGDLSVTASGNLVFTPDEGSDPRKTGIAIDVQGIINIAFGVEVGVGVGNYWVNAQCGVGGTLDGKLSSPYESLEKSFTLDATLFIFGEVKCFVFDRRWQQTLCEARWYPRPSSGTGTYSMVSGDGMIGVDELEIKPRDYLGGSASFASLPSGALSSADDFSYRSLKGSGVFDESNVQYAKLSDGTQILAWIHDDGSGSTANRTSLVYSVKNAGSGWGAIQSVGTESEKGDYYPNMTAVGNKAYITWNRASKVFADNVEAVEMLRSMDVCVSVFENGNFGEPVVISPSNELAEFHPVVAADRDKAAVAWVINSQNDYNYKTGKNSIYVCVKNGSSWGTPSLYAGDLGRVSSFDMDYANGSPAVVYIAKSADGSGQEKSSAYYAVGGSTVRIADSAYVPGHVELSGGSIYMAGKDGIYKSACSTPSSLVSTGIEATNCIVRKNSSGEEAVFFIKEDRFARDLYVSYGRSGSYTAPVPVIKDKAKAKSITYYSPVFSDDGKIGVAYNSQDVKETFDITSSSSTVGDLYDITDMSVCTDATPRSFFVSSSRVACDTADIADGKASDFTVRVTNNTAAAISRVNVTLAGATTGSFCSKEVAVDIPVGESALVTVNAKPNSVANEAITMTVTPVGVTGDDAADNSVTRAVGNSDLCFEDCVLSGDTITGKVKNKGLAAAAGVKVWIGYDSEAKTQIGSFASIPAGGSQAFSHTIPSQSRPTAGSLWDTVHYMLRVTTESNDDDWSNDDEILCETPVKATGVTLDSSSLTLTEKTSGKLTATVAPADAVLDKVNYISGDNTVALVDNDGNVYAMKAGTTMIYACTASGKTAECSVTVEASSSGNAPAYRMSTYSIELEVGGQEPIGLVDADGNKVTSVEWSSSDGSILTVSKEPDGSGIVRGVKTGVALVVAKFTDAGSGVMFADACLVRVFDNSIQAVICQEDTIRLNVGKTKQIEASVVPATTTMDKKLTFVSSDETVATVSGSGVVTAAAEGRAKITITAVNGVKTDVGVIVTAGGSGEDPKPDPNPDPDPSDPWGEIDPDDHPGDSKDDIPQGLWIAGIQNYTYTGKAIIPDVRVYYENRLLRAGRDYSVTCKNNTKAAKDSDSKAPTVTVKGKGNYAGSAVMKFTISKLDIGTTVLAANEFAPATSYKPMILTAGGDILKAGTDYTISYTVDGASTTSAPKKVGSYSLTITGKGSCEGTKTFEFAVTTNARSISKAVITVSGMTYGGSLPVPSVTLDGAALAADTDYRLAFTNTQKRGTAKVQVIGIGKYSGTKTKTFKVAAAKLADGDVTLAASAIYDKGGAKPTPAVVSGGVELMFGTDYSVSYSGNKKLGTAKATVKGKGNYAGTVKKEFAVTAKSLDDSGIQICVSDALKGKKPAVAVYDVNGLKLAAKKDYKAEIDVTARQVKISGGTGGLYTAASPIVRTYNELDSAALIYSATLKRGFTAYPYTGRPVELDKKNLTVKTKSGAVVAADDYTIEYLNNVAKGKATAIIRAKEGTSYGGTKVITFKIKSNGLSKILKWFSKS